jgi:hypothetical protein
MRHRNRFAPTLLSAALLSLTAPLAVPTAHADAGTYLINVTVRPGYNFRGAADALAYGRGICDKTAVGRPFQNLITDIKTDFNTSDEYQASYLIVQAVNELCPALIWQLRKSAAHYRATQP